MHTSKSFRLVLPLLGCLAACASRPASTGPDDEVASITLSVAQLTIPPGFQSQIDVSLRRNDGADITGSVPVQWRSSNPLVATVLDDTREGATPATPIIKANQPGQATLTLAAGSVAANIKVTVAAPGGLIAFYEYDPRVASYDVRVTALDGGPDAVLPVAPPGGSAGSQPPYAYDLALSPSGGQLVYSCPPEGLCLGSLRNGGIGDLTYLGKDPHTPAWSPDGRSLAFSDFEGCPDPEQCAKLVLVDPATGAQTRLGEGTHPSFSPDGERIAWSCSFMICTAQAAGTDAAAFNCCEIVKALAWSADGSELLFRTALDDAEDQIWSVQPDGNAGHPLLTIPRSSTTALWSPDRQWLLTDRCLRRADGTDVSCRAADASLILAVDWVRGGWTTR